MYRASVLVVLALTLVTDTLPLGVISEEEGVSHERYLHHLPHYSKEEYIHHIHSLINAYRTDVLDGRLVIETNSLIDTKYKTWKRNADIINSLLALPKGMSEAGR